MNKKYLLNSIRDAYRKHKKIVGISLLVLCIGIVGIIGSNAVNNNRDILEEAEKSGDKEAIEEAEKEVEKAKEKVNASNSNSSSSNSSSHKSNSGTSNKGSYSKPSNSGGSSNSKPSKPSSGNSGSSGSGGSTTTQPSKPAHQHNWQPIYDYDYANAYEECKKCGAILSDMSKEQLRLHLKECGGSSELKYPTIIVGYQCHSCGATK